MTSEIFVACYPPEITVSVPNKEYIGYDLPIELTIKNKMADTIYASAKIYAVTSDKYIPITKKSWNIPKYGKITEKHSIKMLDKVTVVIFEIKYGYCRNSKYKKIQKVVYPEKPLTPPKPKPKPPTPPKKPITHPLITYSYSISKKKVKPSEHFTVTVNVKSDSNVNARVTVSVDGLQPKTRTISLLANRPQRLEFEFIAPGRKGKKYVHIKIEREELGGETGE